MFALSVDRCRTGCGHADCGAATYPPFLPDLQPHDLEQCTPCDLNILEQRCAEHASDMQQPRLDAFLHSATFSLKTLYMHDAGFSSVKLQHA